MRSRRDSAARCGPCSRCSRRNLTGRRRIMAEYWGIKVEDIFNTMKDRFRPEGAKGVTASYGYDIKDEGKWKVSVYNGALAAVEKTDALTGCVATMSADGET